MSMIPCLIGILVGGSLGALFAYSSHILFTREPRLLQPAAMLPWRTIIAGLLLLVWSPMTVANFGSGPSAGAFIIGIVMTLLALDGALITLFEHWHPSPPLAVLIAGTRALFIIAIVVAVGVGYFGGGGIGSFIIAQEENVRQDIALMGHGVLLAIIFILDLSLGFLQMVAATHPTLLKKMD
jgi:hypothetical protein